MLKGPCWCWFWLYIGPLNKFSHCCFFAPVDCVAVCVHVAGALDRRHHIAQRGRRRATLYWGHIGHISTVCNVCFVCMVLLWYHTYSQWHFLIRSLHAERLQFLFLLFFLLVQEVESVVIKSSRIAKSLRCTHIQLLFFWSWMYTKSVIKKYIRHVQSFART